MVRPKPKRPVAKTRNNAGQSFLFPGIEADIKAKQRQKPVLPVALPEELPAKNVPKKFVFPKKQKKLLLKEKRVWKKEDKSE